MREGREEGNHHFILYSSKNLVLRQEVTKYSTLKRSVLLTSLLICWPSLPQIVRFRLFYLRTYPSLISSKVTGYTTHITKLYLLSSLHLYCTYLSAVELNCCGFSVV